MKNSTYLRLVLLLSVSTIVSFSCRGIKSTKQAVTSPVFMPLDSLPIVFIRSIVKHDFESFSAIIAEKGDVYLGTDKIDGINNKYEIEEHVSQNYKMYEDNFKSLDSMFLALCNLKNILWNENDPVYDYQIYSYNSNSFSYCRIDIWIRLGEIGQESLELIQIPLCIKINGEWKIIPNIFKEGNPFFDPIAKAKFLEYKQNISLDTTGGYIISDEILKLGEDSMMTMLFRPYFIRNSYYVFSDMTDSLFIDNDTLKFRQQSH